MIEDKASGTQLIQGLIREGVHGVTRYEPTMDKIMRMHSVTSTIENEKAEIEIRRVFKAEDFGSELTPEHRKREERLREQVASRK